jgi:integrase
VGISKRIQTKYNGIFYRESITNDKKDKTYYIRYKDINGKDIEKKIGKYSEGFRENYCNQIRNEIITKQRLGEEPPVIAKKKKKQILSIDSIAQNYFLHRRESRSKDTDLSSYNSHILPYFENYDFETVKKDTFINFSTHLENKKGKASNKPLANKTINNILNLLKTIIKYGFKNDLLDVDNSKYIELLDFDNARESFLTKDEIKTLYEYTQHDNTLLLFFKIALTTGARLATILNITKKDIDLTHEIIKLKDFKNNSTYNGFITEDLKSILVPYIEKLNYNDKIFSTNPQKRLRAILNDLFNKQIDKDDRKNKIVVHSLRHTFASHLAINGTPIFTIQKLMNHRDIKMTLRYAKLAPDSGKQSVKDLYNI